MMENKFFLQGKDLKYEQYRRHDNVRFEWNMLYTCNFRCPYCFFEGKWEEYGKRTVFLKSEEWGRLWKRVYDMYGRVSIVITGGEPFVYPEFIEIIRLISEYHFPINISTNASGDLKTFVKKIDPEKVSLTLAFHREFNELSEVLEKLRFIKEHGFSSDYINFCAYPPYLQDLDKYVKLAADYGEKLKVIPFCGEYGSKRYPESYTKEEKKQLGIDEEWEENVKKKGQLCAAGYKSALLFPDGKVVRCGQIGERYIISSFFDDSFKLLETPLECDSDSCPCLEAVSIEQLEEDK